MTTKNAIVFVLKVILVTFVVFLCYFIDFLGLRLTASVDETLLPRLIMALLHAIVISYPIVRSRWSGWPLVFTTFIVYYGVTTFMSQIESVVFLQYLVSIIPVQETPRLFLNGAIRAAIIAPLLVLILGKFRKTEEADETNLRVVMPLTQWIWKLILIAVIYVIIYISFGALIARPLAGKAFEEYYAGLQMPPWIIPFQLLRGVLWAAIALPVIRMMKGAAWEAGLVVSLLFSVLISTLLLLVPNEFMPAAIRFAHFVELFSSMFLFGWIVVVLFNRKHSSFFFEIFSEFQNRLHSLMV